VPKNADCAFRPFLPAFIDERGYKFAIITKAEEWKYSSAIDYYGGKGLLGIKMPDTLTP
jgi:hypothetical protein